MGSRKALAGLLGPPMVWLVVAYLGALATIFATAFFTTDSFTNQVVHTFSLENFREIGQPTYLRIIGRTLLIAVVVTILCVAIAVPFAWFMARVAPRRVRGLLVAAVLVPLWASYLVKAYAWRTMVQPDGVLESTFGGTPGYGFGAVVLTLTYLWLPYMVLPVYAGFERLPESHLEAAADLGGRGWDTFRRVVLPSLLPSIAAGTVFTFSLSLGDYIAVQIVGGKLQVLGTAVLQNITLDLPFAAALGTASVLIMVAYLVAVRRTGALDNL
ncbi:putative spermidine/putrescine transport system permease protein [Pedococcus dokdonensis]|uniref:Putative spermidine/putrescine transport system permease protein n=1 Tax=Pedococcus dokdonensis TaxID=443156 RepID=A0A1H0TAN2_9MICO|nr:ABC transporter permease [Pedococcus dokdonensis]SDP51087.1 putative spermidine/putrescine transport system permease protein [Pedococcus dokdonensis]